MKTLRNYFIITILSITILSSCSKKPNKVIERGNWYVSLYLNSSKNETSDFAGYIFDFKKDGTLAVTLNTGAVVMGTWTYTESSSKYKITISGTDKLDKISSEWFIVSTSSSLIELKDDNSSNEDLLNFTKK